MRYLLDTCALLDMIFFPEQLSKNAKTILESKDCELAVSIASFWEIAVKIQIGKMDIGKRSISQFAALCQELGIEIIQTKLQAIDKISQLPVFKDHGDPFDRLIIVHAQYLRLPVLTSDSKFSRYNVSVVW